MRVLVADDDLGSRLVAQAAVEPLGHECFAAADGLEAWDLFQVWQPEVLVSDRDMPRLDGVALCQRIRAAEKDSYTYLVLLTAFNDPADVLSGMRAGADDYVKKPLEPFELEATLLAASRVTRLRVELALAREELVQQARTDPLTGLRNRLGLASDLEQIHTISQRYGRSYCVAVCDVDHFKRYNDIYGHLAGDQALRAVGATLAAEVRDSDRVYRFGGEEFLVLLPEQGIDGAAIALERVRARLEQLAIAHSGSDNGLLTVSIGRAECTPEHRISTGELIAEADRAMYAAKERGRNRLVLTSEMLVE